MKQFFAFLATITWIFAAGRPKAVATTGAELSYEEKVKAVCACFEARKPKFECFALQSTHGKSIKDPEKRKEFNLRTGACDK
ncbi:MAG: hypothetical protein JNJ69_05255 [Leptospiraceae bacterium]|nr:hypothetical protein [Leptospiraceae bacterium]